LELDEGTPHVAVGLLDELVGGGCVERGVLEFGDFFEVADGGVDAGTNKVDFLDVQIHLVLCIFVGKRVRGV